MMDWLEYNAHGYIGTGLSRRCCICGNRWITLLLKRIVCWCIGHTYMKRDELELHFGRNVKGNYCSYCRKSVK